MIIEGRFHDFASEVFSLNLQTRTQGLVLGELLNLGLHLSDRGGLRLRPGEPITILLQIFRASRLGGIKLGLPDRRFLGGGHFFHRGLIPNLVGQHVRRDEGHRDQQDQEISFSGAHLPFELSISFIGKAPSVLFCRIGTGNTPIEGLEV
ncbi:MAG: hypothetical protein AAF368_19605, partial [Planctomycetota bacterium]